MCDDEEERDSRIFDVFIFLIDELKNFFFFVYLRSRSISTFVNNEHVINETLIEETFERRRDSRDRRRVYCRYESNVNLTTMISSAIILNTILN